MSVPDPGGRSWGSWRWAPQVPVPCTRVRAQPGSCAEGAVGPTGGQASAPLQWPLGADPCLFCSKRAHQPRQGGLSGPGHPRAVASYRPDAADGRGGRAEEQEEAVLCRADGDQAAVRPASACSAGASPAWARLRLAPSCPQPAGDIPGGTSRLRRRDGTIQQNFPECLPPSGWPLEFPAAPACTVGPPLVNQRLLPSPTHQAERQASWHHWEPRSK